MSWPEHDPVARSHPRTSPAIVAATSRSDGGQRPGPSRASGRTRTGRSPSVAPRSARARSSVGPVDGGVEVAQDRPAPGAAPAATRTSSTAVALVAPRVEVDRDREAGRRRRRGHGAQDPEPRRAAPGPRSRSPRRCRAGCRVPSTPSRTSASRRSCDLVDRRRRDPRLVHGLQVLPGPEDDVDAGPFARSRGPRRGSRPSDGGVSSTIDRPPARTNGRELLDSRPRHRSGGSCPGGRRGSSAPRPRRPRPRGRSPSSGSRGPRAAGVESIHRCSWASVIPSSRGSIGPRTVWTTRRPSADQRSPELDALGEGASR